MNHPAKATFNLYCWTQFITIAARVVNASWR